MCVLPSDVLSRLAGKEPGSEEAAVGEGEFSREIGEEEG